MRVEGPHPRREVGRFLRFSVVGVIGAIVDFGTFNVLHVAFGISEIPASVLSFAAAVTSNFIWNRYWTYPDSRSKSVRRQASQFAVVSVIGLAIRTPILALLLGPADALAASLTTRAPWLPLEPPTLGANLALSLAVVVVLFWNFFANRFWTYGDVDRGGAAAGEGPLGRRPV